MVMSRLWSVIREEAQELRLEYFRQTGITAGAGDMSSSGYHGSSSKAPKAKKDMAAGCRRRCRFPRSKEMDDNADLRLVEDALVSYADQGADLEGVTDCFTAAVFKYYCSCSETPERPCHIVQHLAALNDLLFSAKM
ncbi:hypothetical protein HPB52_014090 [Rhipicephalus sanguineus]|uniref:Uncharacterized protein n=1 Tax=Rhipicephalus sanguineus TaxID=34632 RepID=A0A9D4YQ53_RHISA|nr:hypothetical protein HPB52_014090 [Rhipicephalus sanguineus]